MYFISKDGKRLLGPYENIETGFSEGLALVRFGYQDYWYIDKEGNKVLGPYDVGCFPNNSGEFHNGYAIVSNREGKRFVIDRNGNEIISGFILGFESSDHGYFSENLIKLKYEDGFYYVNDKGRKVLGPYEGGWNFSNGLCPVKINGEWWYINELGFRVLGPYYQAFEFVNGLARVDIGEKIYGIIDVHGGYQMGPMDEENDEDFANEEPTWGKHVAYITPFYEDFSIVAINGFGKVYLSKNNEFDDIFLSDDYGFVSASRFVNGMAIVSDQDDNTYVIDKKGRKIFDINGGFNVSTDEPFTKDGYVLCWNKDNQYGFLSEHGEMLEVSSDIKRKLFNKENTSDVFSEKQLNSFVNFIEALEDKLMLAALKRLHENEGKSDEELLAKIKVREDSKTLRRIYYISDPNSSLYGEINLQTLDAQIEEANRLYDERHKAISYTEQRASYENQTYHVIGVQFDSARTGCYYYYGDNNIYNINDRVLVPTANNGNQEATVVFRKIYTRRSDIPYSGNLKTVIKKV